MTSDRLLELYSSVNAAVVRVVARAEPHEVLVQGYTLLFGSSHAPVLSIHKKTFPAFLCSPTSPSLLLALRAAHSHRWCVAPRLCPALHPPRRLHRPRRHPPRGKLGARPPAADPLAPLGAILALRLRFATLEPPSPISEPAGWAGGTPSGPWLRSTHLPSAQPHVTAAPPVHATQLTTHAPPADFGRLRLRKG